MNTTRSSRWKQKGGGNCTTTTSISPRLSKKNRIFLLFSISLLSTYYYYMHGTYYRTWSHVVHKELSKQEKLLWLKEGFSIFLSHCCYFTLISLWEIFFSLWNYPFLFREIGFLTVVVRCWESAMLHNWLLRWCITYFIRIKLVNFFCSCEEKLIPQVNIEQLSEYI